MDQAAASAAFLADSRDARRGDLGYNHFVDAVTDKRNAAAASDSEPDSADAVTWEEIGPRRTTPLVGPMTDVSNPCRQGRHYRCSGRIALQQLRHGKRYTRCKCPYCDHPKIRTMPLKD